MEATKYFIKLNLTFNLFKPKDIQIIYPSGYNACASIIGQLLFKLIILFQRFGGEQGNIYRDKTKILWLLINIFCWLW